MTIAPATVSGSEFVPQLYAAGTGVSLNPDQFHGGLHFRFGSSPTPPFRPVVELGLGNGVRLFSLSTDALYHFKGQQWTPYVGAGPALNFIDVTNGVGQSDGVEMKVVGHAITGLSWTPRRSQRRYFVEGRIGVGDTPRLRLSVGMSF
jgi:hypothetical protein